MPKAYSIDFRTKILEAYLNKEGSNQELADRFKISISTVKRIGQRYRNTGKIELYINRVGRKPKITDEAKNILKKAISSSPDISLDELRITLKKACKLHISVQAIHYFLKKLNLSYKKKSLYACQRDSYEIKKKDQNLLK